MIITHDHEGRFISTRELVAWDITLHGPRFILIEFGVGTPAMILFGLWLILSRSVSILGFYCFLVGVNYMVLLLYAIIIARKKSAKNEVSDEVARNKQYIRKYGLQQFLILIPLAILLRAIAEETIKLVR